MHGTAMSALVCKQDSRRGRASASLSNITPGVCWAKRCESADCLLPCSAEANQHAQIISNQVCRMVPYVGAMEVAAVDDYQT